MDTATSGQIWVDGRNIAKYNNRQLTSYRRDDIGFVFQFYNLVPNLTALENVELAGQICKNPMDPKTVLEEVGLKDRLGNFPASYQAVNSREFPLQELLPRIRRCSFVMSLQVRWITRLVRQFSSFYRICAAKRG